MTGKKNENTGANAGSEMKVKKMSMMGIGHKAGIIIGAYIAITAIVSFFASPLFRITEHSYRNLLTIGIVLAAAGFAANIAAALQMVMAYRSGKLATKGLYSIFLNPMYTLQLFVTLPGILLLFNSWLVLSAVPVSMVVVKILVREEEQYLEAKFGQEYRNYKERVLFKFL